MLDCIKNKELTLPPIAGIPHAHATFFVAGENGPSMAEEIALGQSLGAWDTRFVAAEDLRPKLCRITALTPQEGGWTIEVAFPWTIWHGRLDALLVLLFGKMSFYPGLRLCDLCIDDAAFGPQGLQGPVWGMERLRQRVGASAGSPLLMGILKPNVAMSAATIADLYCRSAQAGVHLLKDDEIRHDADFSDVLARVEAVRTCSEQRGLKTLYAVHYAFRPERWQQDVRDLEQAGAQALLLNVWTAGLGALQAMRRQSALPLMAHPSLLGAFGLGADASIAPQVTMGRLLRAAGADMTLFPSPYGKLGLAWPVVQGILQACRAPQRGVLDLVPVPSAGIKAEHAPLALRDFGTDFVLNAGTGIFASESQLAVQVADFRKGLGLN